jgi:hypothetical protein
MSSNNESAQSGGIGLCGLVFILFLALKLFGVTVVASWSWWWVTAPLWAPMAIVLVIIAAVATGAWLYSVVAR